MPAAPAHWILVQDPRVTPRTLLAYGGPSFAFAYLLFFVQFYFLKFATDVLLLAPARGERAVRGREALGRRSAVR